MHFLLQVTIQPPFRGVIKVPTGNPTNALPPSNNTSTVPPGSIFKVPQGTTNALPPSGNNTMSTPPALTITKEHNPASPNILSLAPNATNPSNNTSALKLSPLTSQHQQTSGGHHHHKGGQTSTSSSSNTNSTGH
jgi:hypothetical protein